MCLSRARGAWYLETCLGKVDQFMLIKDVHSSALIGTSTFQSICFRKIENSLYYVCPARARRMIFLDRMVQLPWPVYQTICLDEYNKYSTNKIAYLPFNHQKWPKTVKFDDFELSQPIWGRWPLKIHKSGTQGARDINLVPKEPSHWVEQHTTTFRTIQWSCGAGG